MAELMYDSSDERQVTCTPRHVTKPARHPLEVWALQEKVSQLLNFRGHLVVPRSIGRQAITVDNSAAIGIHGVSCGLWA